MDVGSWHGIGWELGWCCLVARFVGGIYAPMGLNGA